MGVVIVRGTTATAVVTAAVLIAEGCGGDTIHLEGNQLDCDAQLENIETLLLRGVSIVGGCVFL